MKLPVVCILACLILDTQARQKHGLIVLHGLGGGFGPAFCIIMKKGLRINEDEVRVECPEAECRSHTLLPPTWISKLLPSVGPCVPSWFDFKLMPGLAVLAEGYHCEPTELAAAAQLVEDIIQDMVDDGIPSENIVITGASQGGVLTLHQAVHSKFKLGGFVPIVTWYGNLVSDGPSNYDSVNEETPILHINGAADPIVPAIPAGRETRKAMEAVFLNYEIKYIPFTTHSTTVNPVSFAMMRKFFSDNDLLSVCLSPLCLLSKP